MQSCQDFATLLGYREPDGLVLIGSDESHATRVQIHRLHIAMLPQAQLGSGGIPGRGQIVVF